MHFHAMCFPLSAALAISSHNLDIFLFSVAQCILKFPMRISFWSMDYLGFSKCLQILLLSLGCQCLVWFCCGWMSSIEFQLCYVYDPGHGLSQRLSLEHWTRMCICLLMDRMVSWTFLFSSINRLERARKNLPL